MSDSQYIFEADDSNFESVVISASQRQPVLVDFWAEWCAPCRSLMPLLAGLAEEYRGEFILAKVNSDENQALSAQFGVRSLPTVKLFKNGVPVDEFMGALPESAVRAFIERHIAHESDKLHAAAMQAYRQNDPENAVDLLEKAHAMEPGKSRITIDLASVLAGSGDPARAEEILNELPDYERSSGEAAGLLATLEFAREAAGLPDQATLEAGAKAGDLASLYQLALLHISQSDFTEAMEKLLLIIQKDRGYEDELGRKTLLKLFAVLGEDPLVEQYRKRMTSLLF